VFVPLTIFGQQLLVVWDSGSPVQPSRGGLLVFGLLLVASCLTLLFSPAMRRHTDDRAGTTAHTV
jgi:hypothetical protein